jgi:copper transport protein
MALAVLAITPALAGHPSTQEPSAVLAPADVLHVVAMSVWVGGLALLVAALPAATRRLPYGDRTRLLHATLVRFSPLALASVIALALSGTLEAVLELGEPGDLLDTAFGRAVLIKTVLLALLVGLGAANRRRIIPALRRLIELGSSPGPFGLALRRNLRAEVVVAAVVIGVAAALVSYPPPG